ncbi:MAG TPA: biopolymer transporter ExbD [Rhabdochlamydiaceae bacterium]|nr:biopolymer transporter ExbD [Rhabdochlamydiaceae bacterium]
MSLIPEEEIRLQRNINLAPMVDFLFLILVMFALFAVTRTALYDSEVSLVKGSSEQASLPPDSAEEELTTVFLSINQNGQYKWITEFNEFLIEDVGTILEEIQKQQQLGFLPQENEKIKVLLHIDENATWHSIAQVIYTVKEAGFSIRPVYEPAD